MEGSEIQTSDAMQKLEFLQNGLEDSISRVTRKCTLNRRKAALISVTAIIFSGAATILLGLSASGFEIYFKNIAFALTAIVTMLSAMEPFFNYRALWVEHEQAAAKFYRLLDAVNYYKLGKGPQQCHCETVDAFFMEYQQIWQELSDAWIKERKSYKPTFVSQGELQRK